jgi:hypothetical protein
MEQILSNKSPEEHSIGPLINILEMEYPNENLDDVKILSRLLKKEFGVDFTELDILNHYAVSLEEEDMRLQYKHLNLC